MDISRFEELAKNVRVAKERVSRAEAAYEAAIAECDAARAAEREAYVEFTRYVREAAGINGDGY